MAAEVTTLAGGRRLHALRRGKDSCCCWAPSFGSNDAHAVTNGGGGGSTFGREGRRLNKIERVGGR